MDENRALDWDSEIEKDGAEFTLLEPGIYSFTVTDFERAQYAGSDKVPPCPMAKLTIRCEGTDGSVGSVRDSLFLNTKNEWRMCQFFTAIGQRQHGERLKPNWSKVLGSTGMVRIKYDDRAKNDDGSPKFNRVDAYIDPKDAPQVPAVPQKKWQLGK